MGPFESQCTQSIDCQMKGFPARKPAVVRATVGRVVLGVFFARGRMAHDRVAQVPRTQSGNAFGAPGQARPQAPQCSE